MKGYPIHRSCGVLFGAVSRLGKIFNPASFFGGYSTKIPVCVDMTISGRPSEPPSCCIAHRRRFVVVHATHIDLERRGRVNMSSRAAGKGASREMRNHLVSPEYWYLGFV